MTQFLGRFIRIGAISWIALSAFGSFSVVYETMRINTINPFNSVGDMFSIVIFFIVAISVTLIVSVVGFVFIGIVLQLINKTLINRE